MKPSSKHIMLLFFLILILRIPTLYQPIVDIDESVFSEFASIILQGGAPYIDALDNKPPLTYYFFSIVYYFTGTGNMPAVHAATILIVMATGFFIFRFAGKYYGDKAGIMSLALYVFLGHFFEPKYISTNSETLINLPLVISAILFFNDYTREKRSFRCLSMSGLLLGLAVLINYKAGILAFLFIVQTVYFIYINRNIISRRILTDRVIRLGVTGFFSIVPIAAVAVYFLRLGNFSDFYIWGFKYNFGYINSGSQSLSLLRLSGKIGLFLVLSLPVWYIFFLASFRKKNRNSYESDSSGILFFLFAWAVLSFYVSTMGGRTYGHYFIQLTVPLSLLAGILYNRINISAFARRTIFVYCAVILIFFTVLRIDIDHAYKLLGDKNWKALQSYRSVGDYIKINSTPGDTIYAWGWATPVYFYSDRRSASRFLISDFVSGRIFGTPNDSPLVRTEMTEKNLPVLISDLEKKQPLFFIDTTYSDYFGYKRFPLEKYRELNTLINDGYTLVHSIDNINIYERKR